MVEAVAGLEVVTVVSGIVVPLTLSFTLTCDFFGRPLPFKLPSPLGKSIKGGAAATGPVELFIGELSILEEIPEEAGVEEEDGLLLLLVLLLLLLLLLLLFEFNFKVNFNFLGAAEVSDESINEM